MMPDGGRRGHRQNHSIEKSNYEYTGSFNNSARKKWCWFPPPFSGWPGRFFFYSKRWNENGTFSDCALTESCTELEVQARLPHI